MTTLPLLVDGAPLARYHDGTSLPVELSPRPFLHPVLSPAGVEVTEVRPQDHLHHVGVSLAVADVSGTSYWGGKSYVHPGGYTMLPNQGRQVGGEPQLVVGPGSTALAQRLTWYDADGAAQVLEDRRVRIARAAVGTGGGATTLHWRSDIVSAGGDLLLGSPATRGRTGAGYGGLFWRVGPERETVVRTAEAEGEEAVLGTVTPWLALTQHRETGPVTLLLGQPADAALPWFVRVGGYVGAGPALAWDPEPVPVRAGERRRLDLWAAVVDDDVDLARAAELYDHLRTSSEGTA